MSANATRCPTCEAETLIARVGLPNPFGSERHLAPPVLGFGKALPQPRQTRPQQQPPPEASPHATEVFELSELPSGDAEPEDDELDGDPSEATPASTRQDPPAPLAAAVDPFGAPAPSDPFGAPAAPGPFGAPPPFGPAPAADPFGAPPAGGPFGRPLGPDPFAPPLGPDPFAPPLGVNPFGAPAGGDPFGPSPLPPREAYAPAPVDPFGIPAGANPFPPLHSTDVSVQPVAANPFASATGQDLMVEEPDAPGLWRYEAGPSASPPAPDPVFSDWETKDVFAGDGGPSSFVGPAVAPAGESDTSEPVTLDWLDVSGAPGTTRLRVSRVPLRYALANRYEVVQEIGRGGFACVYRVRDTVGYLHESLAVKLPFVSQDPEKLLKRLRSQFKAWKYLSDTEPNRVVRLRGLEVVEIEGTPSVAILMELMEGGNLGTLVEHAWKGPPSTRERLANLLRLFLQACAAVARLHEQGLLHRDIKPGNLLLDQSQTHCKLSDFELLLAYGKDGSVTHRAQGTVPYMAPECFECRYSPLSDVFALGATLYRLLTGRTPFPNDANAERETPAPADQFNPFIPPELAQIVQRCLEIDPRRRPQSVPDLIRDLTQLGLADEGAHAAPLNLARLLLSQLDSEDREYLARSLTRRGYRARGALDDQHIADLVEEYCYTESPHEVLAENCTGRQLDQLARTLGLDPLEVDSRKALIGKILTTVGFLPGPREVPGLESSGAFLDGQLLNLMHATTRDELAGMIQSGLMAVERAVGLLNRFYGQLCFGSGVGAFLSRHGGGKPPHRLTFGQKVSACRGLCSGAPPVALPPRLLEDLRWPLFEREIFSQLSRLVSARNRLAHDERAGSLQNFRAAGQRILATAHEVVARIAASQHAPRVVQIVSRQEDVYGRLFYVGQDDRQRMERIFTPLPLKVGDLYLFFTNTKPVRINPLIFPFELPVARKRSGA